MGTAASRRDDAGETSGLGRRQAAAAIATLIAGIEASKQSVHADPGSAQGVPAVTHTVFIDVGLCDSIVRADRALGNKGGVCVSPETLGRITIGLYGDLVPNVVRNFVSLCEAPTGEGYAGTVFHRVKPGEYVLAGQAGSYRLGQVQTPRFDPNPEMLSSTSFKQRHLRPGTVSLALAAATGEGDGGAGGLRSAGTQFLITTGPAPVPSLDGENVVFGRVIKGMDVVAGIAAVPTFRPSGNSVAWNQVAEWLRDERAAKARESWSKPTQAIVITDAGVLTRPDPAM